MLAGLLTCFLGWFQELAAFLLACSLARLFPCLPKRTGQANTVEVAKQLPINIAHHGGMRDSGQLLSWKQLHQRTPAQTKRQNVIPSGFGVRGSEQTRAPACCWPWSALTSHKNQKFPRISKNSRGKPKNPKGPRE